MEIITKNNRQFAEFKESELDLLFLPYISNLKKNVNFLQKENKELKIRISNLEKKYDIYKNTNLSIIKLLRSWLYVYI